MAHIQLLKRLHDSMCLKPKPKQIRRWEELLHGNDVIGVFPAEFKKSFAFQLLPFILSPRCPGSINIVLVVCRLNPIIGEFILQLKRIGKERF